MSDKSITLLELHLGDGDVTIGAFGLTGGANGVDDADKTPEIGDKETGDAIDDDTGGDGSGGRCGCSIKCVGGFVLAVGVLAVVAVAVAKLLGGDDTAEIDG